MKRQKNILVFLLLFAVLLVVKTPDMTLQPHWDEQTYLRQSIEVAENNLNPFLEKSLEKGGTDFGHPPLFRIIYGLWIFIFGNNIFLLHMLSLIFSSLALFFVYLIGKEEYSAKVGIIAAFILLFSAQFFSNSIMLLPTALTTFLVLLTIYFYIKKNIPGYLIAAIFLVLHREQMVFLIGSLALHTIIINKKNKIFKSAIIISPISAFMLWMFFKEVFFPAFSAIERIKIFSIQTILFKAASFLYFLALDDGRWAITITLSVIIFQSYKINKKRLILSGFVLLMMIFLIPIIKTQEMKITFLTTCALVISTILFFRKNSIENILKKLNTFDRLIMLISATFFFAFVLFAEALVQRYIEFIIALYILIFTSKLVSYKNDQKNLEFKIILFALIFIVLLMNHSSDRINLKGASFEDNMEYKEYLQMRLEMAKYLETNYPNTTVFVDGAIPTFELTDPNMGFVTKSLNIISAWPNQKSELVKNAQLIYVDHALKDSSVLGNKNLEILKLINKGNKNIYLFKKNDLLCKSSKK